MVFRAGGIISGLDTNTIISQLVALERQPITKLQTRQTNLTQQKTLFGQIGNLLATLKTKLDSIDSADKLLSFQTTSSDKDKLTVSASGAVVPGSHTVQILQLAKGEQDRSTAFGDPSDLVKAGTLTITVQGDTPIVVDIAAGDTLDEVASTINQKVSKVSAVVIDTGTSVYLTLYAKETGHQIGGTASDAIVLSESYTGLTGQELGLAETVTAQNAQIKFDDLPETIEKRSNQITGVVNGLALNLHDATGQPTVTVEVQADVTGTKSKINDFIASYNSAISLINSQFVYTQGAPVGVLFGDATLRGLEGQIGSRVSETVENVSGIFTTLREIGIKTGAGGLLSLDDAKFQTAVANDFNGIAALFSTPTTGIAAKLDELIDRYTNSTDGLFKYRQKGIDDRYQSLADQIAQLDDRATAYETLLVQQFTAMENIISKLRVQQSQLAGLGV